jgi:predicted glycoside hydrolase/deacetylase ChbG (UPF0249 family)
VLIINADDWGRAQVETDAALECHQRGCVTAVSAMVFMADSERAANIALEYRVDVGLHLNFSQEFDQPGVPAHLHEHQGKLMRFTLHRRFPMLLYNPLLRESFRRAFQAQWNEFIRIYGAPPSHVDGHHHRHLCANLLVDRFIPAGLPLRRNFTYAKDERGTINRVYRHFVDRLLLRRYRLTDSFFSLAEVLRSHRMSKVIQAARTGTVELMTHPIAESERLFLLSDEFATLTRDIDLGSFARS